MMACAEVLVSVGVKWNFHVHAMKLPSNCTVHMSALSAIWAELWPDEFIALD